MFCEPNLALLNFLYLLPSVGEVATWVHVCIDRIYCHDLDDASNTSGYDLSVCMSVLTTVVPIFIFRAGSQARGRQLVARARPQPRKLYLELKREINN